MKKVVYGLLFCTMFFVGCTKNDSVLDSSESSSQHTDTAESNSSFVVFNSGVNTANEIYGDSQNYANINGTVQEGDMVYLIDKESGIVHGTSKVSESGSFNISCNMQGVDERDVIFTNDSDITFPKVEDTATIKNRVDLKFIANDTVDSQTSSSSNDQEESGSDSESSNKNTLSYGIGDTVTFTIEDGGSIDVTIESVSKDNGDDWHSPKGAFFAKVTFLIKNTGSTPFDANSQYFEFYDSSDIKSELNLRDYFSETIQAGKSAQGTAYFDISNDGSNFEIYFADASWTGNYE